MWGLIPLSPDDAEAQAGGRGGRALSISHDVAALVSAAPAKPLASALCDIIVSWETVRELLPLCFKGHNGIFI